MCDDGEVHLKQVPSSENAADFFTKALDRVAFEKHRATIMGPQDNPGKQVRAAADDVD